jgi:hypothetical protein
VKFQAQAVLRRDDLRAPLRLAGVLLGGSFYPGSAQDAWGPLHLEAGLVALAPLTPVVSGAAPRAAAVALEEARLQWADGNATPAGASLAWRPMRDVRKPGDGQSIAELIELMSTANDARLMETPSTPLYHDAARELERLATVIYDTASSEERVADDAARRHERRPGGRPDA